MLLFFFIVHISTAIYVLFAVLLSLYLYIFCFFMIRRPPRSTRTDTLFPYTTLFRSLAVLALIISAVVWAMGSNSSNPHLAGRGKLGVVVALGAAIVTGAAVALVNFFWNVGQAV